MWSVACMHRRWRRANRSLMHRVVPACGSHEAFEIHETRIKDLLKLALSSLDLVELLHIHRASPSLVYEYTICGEPYGCATSDSVDPVVCELFQSLHLVPA
jgi:hypothetical protein